MWQLRHRLHLLLGLLLVALRHVTYLCHNSMEIEIYKRVVVQDHHHLEPLCQVDRHLQVPEFNGL